MYDHIKEEIENLQYQYNSLIEEYEALAKDFNLEIDNEKKLKLQRRMNDKKDDCEKKERQIEKVQNGYTYEILYKESVKLSYREQKKLVTSKIKTEKAFLLLVDGYGKNYHEWFYKHILPTYFKKVKILKGINTKLLNSDTYIDIIGSVFCIEDEYEKKEMIEKIKYNISEALKDKTLIAPIRISGNNPNYEILKQLLLEVFFPICKEVCNNGNLNHSLIILFIGEGVQKTRCIETNEKFISEDIKDKIHYKCIANLSFNEFDNWIENSRINEEGIFYKHEVDIFKKFLDCYDNEQENYLSPCLTAEGTLSKVFQHVNLDFDTALKTMSKIEIEQSKL